MPKDFDKIVSDLEEAKSWLDKMMSLPDSDEQTTSEDGNQEAEPEDWRPDQELENVWWATLSEKMACVTSIRAYLEITGLLESKEFEERPEVMLIHRDITNEELEVHPFEWGSKNAVRIIDIEMREKLGKVVLPSPKPWLGLIRGTPISNKRPPLKKFVISLDQR